MIKTIILLTVFALGLSLFIFNNQVSGQISASEYTNDSTPKTIQNNSKLCQGTSLCISSKIQKIYDGDTLQINGYIIRLSLTNTPEKTQKGFNEATSFTKKLCPVGSTILFDQDDKQKIDKSGRVLGKVFCSGKNLNAELLYNNHAKISKQFCSVSEFSAETWAQKYGCATKEVKPQIQKETPKTSLSKGSQCDASYPEVCIKPYPPDLDCKDISYKNFRVLPPDLHRFDGDKDGIGCETK
jgi:micrococcal nuclease